jgi:regulator of protease activity HflC (stomatin/prohibitin superfamily)
MSLRDDEYQMSWFDTWLPPEQVARWRTHRSRAFLRMIPFFVLTPLVALALVYLFNVLLFGGEWSLTWLVIGILPALIALLGVLATAGQFVNVVFGLKSWWAGVRYAFLCLFGIPWPLPYPYALITEGGVRERDRRKFLAHRQLGGPGRLIIFNDSAVVLERHGRVTRTAGPGAVFLERFERIREIIDLRPQIKTLPAEQAIVVTRDGILVGTEITVRFQIKRGTPTAPEKPYPVDDAMLMAAATAPAVRIGPNPGQRMISGWRDRVLRNVDSTLRDIVAGKTLDELFEPADPYKDPREEIRCELLAQLTKSSAAFGAEVLDIVLGPFKPVNPEVERQRLATWQATRQAEDRVKEACGEAQAMLTRESAYAYAQLEMMLAIDRGFRRLVIDGENLTSQFVALRFIEMLRRTAGGADTFLLEESTKTLEFLNRLLTGRAVGAGGTGGTGESGGTGGAPPKQLTGAK